MEKFVISDNHFNHYNIIQYCDRPFKTTEEMNAYMIAQWNKTVSHGDLVYHLGDFGFGRFESLQNIFNQLNGEKILIMGNHDRRLGGVSVWTRIGYIEVHKELIIDNKILSHYPLMSIPNNMINYHGHIHNNITEGLNARHINYSVEMFDYIPQPF